ncbi:MAG: methylhydantoinase [Rhodospirillaceae bacterium]|jgi:N-methylhydantoinase B|nr:methylhydantoinase [Rhodospirillaceae bacterium]
MLTKELDPITLQVISGALDTIAEEMGHILYRMSFSSIIRESQDLGAGLFDTEFNTLCESESSPLHIGSLPGYLEGIRETLQGGSWNEGDVVIHNHPYFGSSHSPDIAIVIPIFYQGKLVGFAGNTAHHLDIGAATPGLIIDIPDVYAEGMLFAGTKLYEGDKRNEALWEFIGRNSRAAPQLQRDIEAQIASARLGVRRFQELIERYGLDTVLDATQQLMDYAERVLRQRIAAIPDGEYRAEGFLDDDGKNRGVNLPIKVCVRIQGDGIEIDLTGSADQVETGFNVPFEGSTKVACFCAIRSLLLDAETSEIKVPSNQGTFRPITVTAPKGSIYNPEFPAAAEARFSQINRMIDLIYKALAPVLPDDIIAGSSAVLSFVAYSGVRPSGDYWVFLEVNEGSYGGRPKSDGPDSIDALMANTRNNPLEDLAIHLPMICDRYELRDDVMPGAGRQRGGFGVVKAQRLLSDGFITHENERHEDVPWGIFGGQPGATGRVEIFNIADPTKRTKMPAKFSGMRVREGDVHVFYGPCGGGYGEPLERPPEQVLEDVLDDFCTLEHAREVYGVVVDLESESVDVAATEARRRQMQSGATERPEPAPQAPVQVATPPVTAPAPEPAPAATSPIPPPPSPARQPLADAIKRLHQAYGDDWSFDIISHSMNGGSIEVVGEVRANGAQVRETGSTPGGNGMTMGRLLEAAANDSLRRCTDALLGTGPE